MMKTKILKIVAVMSGFLLILQFLYPLGLKFILRHMMNQNIGNPYNVASVGIIGGADGPTSIFVARNTNTFYLVLRYGFLAISAVVFIVSVLLMRRKR